MCRCVNMPMSQCVDVPMCRCANTFRHISGISCLQNIVKLCEKLSETLCSKGFTIKVFKVSQSAEYRLRKTKTAKGRELGGLKIFVILSKTSRTLRNLSIFAVKYIVRLREKLSETLCSRSFTIKVFKVSRSAEYRLRKIKTALGRELSGLKIFVILGKTSRTLRNPSIFAVKKTPEFLSCSNDELLCNGVILFYSHETMTLTPRTFTLFKLLHIKALSST